MSRTALLIAASLAAAALAAPSSADFLRAVPDMKAPTSALPNDVFTGTPIAVTMDCKVVPPTRFTPGLMIATNIAPEAIPAGETVDWTLFAAGGGVTEGKVTLEEALLPGNGAIVGGGGGAGSHCEAISY